ncbi:MAG: peptide ABC transporter substrate-binding protein [Oscillibacter sp.]|jgi:oligopeptide transport system substrate-binding protein|nr:peptide ABC transporter substrate-binding protein [Oscillibacter sp.]
MNWIKRAAAACLAVVACGTLLTACGEKRSDGGEDLRLSVCVGQAPSTLDPIRAVSQSDQTVIGHLYQNLMETPADGSDGALVYGAAKHYDAESNYDGTVTYTFRLRSAKWSDGQAVTADDFVYAWRRLADPASASPYAELLSVVVGYDQVRTGGDSSKLKVTAKNDSTLVVTLTGECPWFLTDVCTAAATVPLRRDVVQRLKKEAAAAGEKSWCADGAALVTNGPYRFGASGEDSLTLNAASADASGPVSITFRYAATAEEAWKLYEDKEVDFVSPLPQKELARLAEDKNWTPVSELNTCAVLFNTAQDPFSDPLVREAFSLTVNRTSLSELAGAAARPADGLVPSGVPESGEKDFRTSGGSLIDCDPEHEQENREEAQSLLDRAGYDRNHGLPALECLYVGGDSVRRETAEALAEMWSEALDVQVKPVAMTEEKFRGALESGTYALAVADITGCANDAESFLAPWVSDSTRNVTGYRNSAYDTLLSVIDSAGDETARLGCLHDAESLLLEDCPLTPLYFTGTACKLRNGLTGVRRDARGWFSFASVAVKPAE